MAKYGRGLICLALEPALVDKLQLPLMARRNTSKFGTNFTVSIEAKQGVTTGISAHDRALTIQTAVADETTLTWPPPATSSPCAPSPAGCWCASGRPRFR
ncbi:hypothetical protein MASR2M17_23560 [Aminivibrio sp.]